MQLLRNPPYPSDPKLPEPGLDDCRPSQGTGVLLSQKRKRSNPRSCPRCHEEELVLSDEGEPDDLYCLTCGVSFRARGRQGRNAKSRLPKSPSPAVFEEFCCKNCKSFIDLVCDHASGDLVCTICGYVNDDGGKSFSSNIILMKKSSKNYMRRVHFRQRTAQLLGEDPEVSQGDLDLIWEHLLDKKIDWTRTGKKNFGAIIRILGMPKKLSSSWIQIRNELGLYPNTLDIRQSFDEALRSRVEVRFCCVEQAFNATLSSKHGSTHRLKRTNIINLNYIIPQIIRLESPQIWEQTARFFKQLTHEDHPHENNARWKEIILFCQKHFRKARASKDGGELHFSWPYNPMTTHEILTKYNFFY